MRAIGLWWSLKELGARGYCFALPRTNDFHCVGPNAKGLSWDKAGYLGSLAAAEVISHFGARPEKTIQLED